MTQFLNLDEVADAVKRTVTVKGNTYEVEPTSVGEFISQAREAEKAEKVANGETTPEKSTSEIFEELVAGVQKSVPTMPLSVIRGLTMEQLAALMKFLRATPDVAEGAGEGK